MLRHVEKLFLLGCLLLPALLPVVCLFTWQPLGFISVSFHFVSLRFILFHFVLLLWSVFIRVRSKFSLFYPPVELFRLWLQLN